MYTSTKRNVNFTIIKIINDLKGIEWQDKQEVWVNRMIVLKANYCFENEVERKSRKRERPNKNIQIWFYYNNDYIKLIHVMYDYI